MGDLIRITRPANDKAVFLNAAVLAAWPGRWKDLGLLAYLLSLHEGTQITSADISAVCKDGREATRTGLRSLEKMGFLERRMQRNNAGQIEGITYIVRTHPIAIDEAAPL